MVEVRVWWVRRVAAARAAPVVMVALTVITLVSSVGLFTATSPTPSSVFGTVNLDPYIPATATATRTSPTTCQVTWTASATASPPTTLRYDVTDGTGGVLATGLSTLTTTITIPNTTITPTVRVRAAAWTSTTARTSDTPCWGPPGPPTTVMATPGSGQAAVSWTAPTGAPTTTYTATATPTTGPTRTCSTTTLTCTITGLTDGLKYTITITGTNIAGTGTTSTPITVTPYPAVIASTDSVLWLDADAPTTLFTDTGCTTAAAFGGTVGCWKDRSASGANATRSTPAERPTLRSSQLNSRAAVRFTSNTLLIGPDVLNGSTRDMNVFVVSRENASSNGKVFTLDDNSATRFLVHGPYGPNRTWYWDAGSCCSSAQDSSASPAGVTAVGDTTIFTAWKDNVDTGNGFRLNSGATYPSSGNTTAVTAQGFQIGHDVTDHDIAEVVAFDRRLTAAEQRAVEEYLARKWGRSITPAAPTSVTPSVTGTSATITWTTPAWDGGATITGYTTTAVPTSGGGPSRTCTATPPTTTCTLTSLADGSEYALSVTATNTHGTGPGSVTVPLLTSAPHSSNLALWLDAAAPSTLFTDTSGTTPAAAGQEVHRWADRSGSNRHAVKGAASATGATLTTSALNGRTAMRFTRTANEFYEVTGAGIGAVGSADRTLMVVGTARTIRGNQAGERSGAFAVWPGNHSGLEARGPLAPGAAIDQIVSETWNASTNTLSSLSTAPDVPHIMTQTAATVGGLLTNNLILDGRAPVTSTHTPASVWRTYPDMLRVGGAGNLVDYQYRLDGDIAEVLLYNRALTTIEHRAAESYLAAKWGLTLAPDAPTGGTGTGGVNEVTATWTAPGDTGGAPITSYTATATPSALTCTAVAPATTCTITGLASNTSHTITVTATNTIGTGRASTPSAPVNTLPYPAAPTGVSALTTSTRMEVSWTAPTDTGGSPITDYTIQYRILGDTTWTTHTDPVTTTAVTVITGLTSATTYQTRVAATNSSGAGLYSTPATSAPGQAWTPTHLTGGTAIWFDADDATTLTTTSGAVDQWRDKSGNARHANQTGTARPTLTAGLLNSRPAVVFDGTDDYLPFDGAFIAGTDYTVAVAVARVTVGNRYLGGTQAASNRNLGLGWTSNTGIQHAQFANDYGMTVPGYTTPIATTVVNRHSATTGKNTHIDGVLAGSLANTTPLASWAGSAIGRALTSYFTGRVGEIVIATTALGTPDRQRLEGYLAQKWGTPLPAGHPYTGQQPLTPALPAAAPTGVTALTSGTRLEASWTAPGDTGGTPITDYTIQYRLLGDTTWTTYTDPVTTNTVAMITGLTPATTYQTRIAAVTAVGTGTYTAAVTSAPGHAWTPTNLTGGTTVWFDADDPTTLSTSSGGIDQWRNKAGSTRHASQTGASRPTLTAGLINGRPAAVFDGTNDNLPFDGTLVAGSNYTVAAAIARTSNKAINYYLGGTTFFTDNANLHLGWRTDTTLTHGQYNNDHNMTVPAYTSPTPVTVVNRHSSTDGKSTYADGVSLGTRADTAALVSWAGAAIGKYDYNQFFSGRVGEIVITTTALTPRDRQRLEGYLALKWGTPLPAGHPYATQAPLTLAVLATAPTGVTALTSGTRMEASWTAPSDTGSSPVTDYTVQYRVLGDTTWTTATDAVSTNTTTVVTGLAAATTYQTRIAAVTAVGTGTYTTPATSTPGQTWTPANLPGGTAAWFDADDPTTFTTSGTGSGIDQWRDKSGNNRHSSQVAPDRPIVPPNTVNGRPAVVFDGIKDFMPFDGSFLAGANYTIAATTTRTSNRADSYYLGGTATTTDTNFQAGWRTNTSTTHAQYNNDYNMTVPGYTTPTTTSIINQHSNTTGKATYTNGALTGSNTNTTPLTSWAGAAMGRREGFFFPGNIGEVVITTSTLTTPDRQRLEGYLAQKWGTPLPTGHPYVTSTPLRP